MAVAAGQCTVLRAGRDVHGDYAHSGHALPFRIQYRSGNGAGSDTLGMHEAYRPRHRQECKQAKRPAYERAIHEFSTVLGISRVGMGNKKRDKLVSSCRVQTLVWQRPGNGRGTVRGN